MRKESMSLAITFSLLASLCYATLAFLIKITEHYLPNPMIIFFRQAISFCILMPLLPLRIGSYRNLKTDCFHLHLLRAFSSIAAMFCLYFAIRYLPLMDAVLLSYTRPLFIPIVVYLWFRKKWTKNTWIGLCVGFLGVVLILKPDEALFDVAALVGLAAGMFGSIAFTTIRRLTKTEPPDRILFYFLAISLPLTSIPLAGAWQTPTLHEWGLLAVIGIGATFYQMFLTRAYRHAKAVKVGSLLYSSVIFAWIFDFFLGSGQVSLAAVIGMTLIIFGSFIALYESKAGA